MSLSHVSDTALLVAAARALETARPDGLVRDPYAARLAGDRGMALAETARTESGWNSLGIGLRSRFIDELLMAELSRNSIDCVVSLGAGLDARPWRLDLPKTLRWLEVDFETILSYKYAALEGVETRCQLEHLVVDLNDAGQRHALFTNSLAVSGRVLLLTEGLLIYLPASTVASLAREALDHFPMVSWILDVSSAHFMASGAPLADAIASLGDETRLSGEEILRTLTRTGWVIHDRRTCLRAGARFLAARARELAGSPNAVSQPMRADDPTGIWLVGRGQ